MMRRAMRIFLRWVLPIGGLALSVYLITAELLGVDSFLVRIASAAGAGILIELVFVGVDRLAPMEKPRKRDTPPVDEQTYIDDRLAFFEREKELFVPLAGEALIETRFDAFREGLEAGEVAPQQEGVPYDDILKVADERGFERFVLIGDPGAGKTTSLRKLFAEAAPERPPLPLWIDLGYSANPADAEKLIDYWWYKVHQLKGSPRPLGTWLFLDGLNEMPGSNPAARAKSLKKWFAAHPDTRVVVTCRMRDYDEGLDLGLPIVRLHELDQNRIEEFTQRRLKPEQVGPFRETIAKRPNLQAITRNPYNLVMMLDLYRRRGKLPDNLYELYRMYLKLRYEDYTEKRKATGQTRHVRLPWKRLHRKLERLAFRMIDKGRGTIAGERWVQWRIGRQALRDGFDMGVLVQDEGGGAVRFYHQSLHEHFALPGLTKRLKSGSVERQQAYIKKIGDLGEDGAPAIGALGEILVSDDRRELRLSAAKALRVIGDPAAVELLIDALHDEYNSVCIAAANALGEIGDPAAVEPLIQALQGEDKDVRFPAARALGEIGDPTAVEPLIQALHGEDKNMHTFAAGALGKIRDPTAVVPLIRALRDEDEYMRIFAADALGKISDPAAIEPLSQALSDENSHVRSIAAQALGQLGSPAAVAPLMQALHDKDSSSPATDILPWALEKIEVVAAFPWLMQFLQWRVRVCDFAAQALEQIGTPEALAAVKAWRERELSE